MKSTTLTKLILSMAALTWIVSGCGGQATTAPAPADAVVAPDAVTDLESESFPTATFTPEPQTEAASDMAPGTILTDVYDDALGIRNQLALGTLRLSETESAVSADQANALSLYWQALRTLGADSTTAAEELTAIQDQIIEVMTEAQLIAIQEMRLTDADLTAFYAEMGLEISTPEPGTTPMGTGGGRSGMSQEEREAAKATATALGTPVGMGAGGGAGAARRDVLIDTVIELLGAKANE